MKFHLGKIVNAPQGSDIWHALRGQRKTASEAPAAAGKSKYLPRNGLLEQKATGIAPDVDSHMQRIFDDGHKAEALARPFAEAMIDDELFPVVLDDAEGGFLASMDGLTMCRTIGWEHKMLNDSLARQVDAGQLDEHYLIQLDQQFALSGAQRILFTASHGTEESAKHLWVERDESRFAPLEAVWAQFDKDLADYQPPEAAQPKAEGKAPDSLPALVVQVQGMVTASNLKAFEDSARAALSSINTDLQTDQDFADAEKAVKFCKDVEARLVGAKDNVLGQMSTVDEVVKTIDRISEETRQLRLKLNKAVTEQKEQRKLEILKDVRAAYNRFYVTLESALECEAGDRPITLKEGGGPDFGGAMKGKRTISSLRSACDDTLANAKIELTEIADGIRVNIRQLNEHAGEYAYLFSDFGRICQKPAEDFAAVVKTRIADHQKAEQARLDAQREQIRREEEAKAQTKLDAERQAQHEAEQQALRSKQQAYEASRILQADSAKASTPEPARNVKPAWEYEAPAHTSKAAPSLSEIIGVLSSHYGVDRNTAALWLTDIRNQEQAA